MKLVYLSPTSLLFLGKSSSTSGIGKALINCKRRMGGESPSNDNNPFYDTSFKTHQDAAHAFLFSSVPTPQSFSSKKFSPLRKLLRFTRVPLILEMIIERFFWGHHHHNANPPPFFASFSLSVPAYWSAKMLHQCSSRTSLPTITRCSNEHSHFPSLWDYMRLLQI